MIKRKNLNVIFLVIAMFFSLTSLMFYFYLQKVDASYTRILSKQVESFHKLRSITKLSNSNFLLAYQTYLKPDINRDSMRTLWLNGMTENSENFDKLYQAVNTNKFIDSIYQVLIQSRAEYKNSCNGFFSLSKNMNNSKKEDFFRYSVQTSFSNYQENLDSFTEYYKAEVERESDFLTSNVHKDSLSLLFFGFSPIALIIISIVGILLLIFGLIWSFNMKIISLDI